jgi:hypothetical protein
MMGDVYDIRPGTWLWRRVAGKTPLTGDELRRRGFNVKRLAGCRLLREAVEKPAPWPGEESAEGGGPQDAGRSAEKEATVEGEEEIPADETKSSKKKGK